MTREATGKQPLDVAVSDLTMPGRGGIGLVRYAVGRGMIGTGRVTGLM